MRATTARKVAALVLVRVEKDLAFAAAALDAELARAPQLEARDRAFATELVYGSLRVRPWLEGRLERYASRGLRGTDLFTRVELLLAAYQIFFSRVPAFAAVNEAVESIRLARGVQVSRFANALLRKLSKEAERLGEGGAAASLADEAVWASAPEWLREALRRGLGEQGARSFLGSSGAPPPVGIRVERAAERDQWLDRFRKALPSATFEPGLASPLAILARGAGRTRMLPGFDAGAWAIQEEGSQVVALAVGATPSDRVLDACAGRGNKAAILARAVLPAGCVDVADSHPDKLDRLATELGRVGLAARASFAVDWSVGSGACGDLYDRVLVDAPCSGTGTIRRRPELLLRRQPEDLEALSSLQRAIVARVAERVRAGGRLVYAVCSVLPEEAEAVVESVLLAVPSLELAPFDGQSAGKLAGEGQGEGAGTTTLRLLPQVHGTDGYFLASFRKKE
jgi:16S rRNA (cytosine967-C5)-methyltransferase